MWSYLLLVRPMNRTFQISDPFSQEKMPVTGLAKIAKINRSVNNVVKSQYFILVDTWQSL